MTNTSDLTARYAGAAGPGKFEGNAYPHAAAYVHDLTLDGQTAEETGSATEGAGWYGLVYLSEDQRDDVTTLGWERDTDAAPESRPVAAIVAEDTRGFVDVTFYDSEDAAQADFASVFVPEDEEDDQ